MIKIVAVSVSSFTKINRAVYYALSAGSLDVTIIVPARLKFGNGYDSPDAELNSKINLVALDLTRNNPRTYYFKGLTKLLSELKPDLVYLENEPISYMALQLGTWCKGHHAKLYCQTLENIPLSLNYYLKVKGFKGLIPFIYKRALNLASRNLVTKVFSINNEGVNIYRNLGYKSVSHIPLGYDTTIFYKNEEKRNRVRDKLNYKGLIIGYFGRLQKEKGVELLVNALENLLDFDWRFIIDKFDRYKNEYSQYLFNRLTGSAIKERVIFIEANHYEIADYMNATDVVIVPSYTTPVFKEQYGRVVQEAMACGNILIVSTCGALPDLIGNAGIIINEKNAGDIELNLKLILTDPLAFSSKREAAVHRAKEFLTVGVQANTIINSLN